MIGFIFLLLLAVAVLVACLLGAKAATTSSAKSGLRWGGGVAFLIFVALAVGLCCTTSVGTKDIGVETAYGHTEGELGPGLHFIAPDISVTTMDGAIQTDSYMGSQCLSIRVANQQTACVDISIRWRIDPKMADSLFQNYRTFNNVRDSLVTRELMAAVNNQLANYNPLNSVEGATSASNPPLSRIAASVTKQMQKEIGGEGIEVLSTIIPIISFDSETQARINQLQQQVALTRIAEQAIQTNQDQAKANEALAQSVANNPNVLKAECLNDLSQMIKQNMTVPAGFDCGLGSGVSGVIANATGTAATSGK